MCPGSACCVVWAQMISCYWVTSTETLLASECKDLWRWLVWTRAVRRSSQSPCPFPPAPPCPCHGPTAGWEGRTEWAETGAAWELSGTVTRKGRGSGVKVQDLGFAPWWLLWLRSHTCAVSSDQGTRARVLSYTPSTARIKSDVWVLEVKCGLIFRAKKVLTDGSQVLDSLSSSCVAPPFSLSV